MSTALLEQSRNILRRCFSVLNPKQVYTLQFECSVEDSAALVTQLQAKLASAVAAPSCAPRPRPSSL